MTSVKNRVIVWLFAAFLAPLLLIGVLLGAFSNADTATERIPVALVNNDEIIIEEDENGEETFFLASRPLVLELVGGDDITLDWQITDSQRAADMLERGEVYAIFEIPKDFSKKVQTLESTEPEQATFIIRTNPSRSYLTGVVAEQIGIQVAAALNEEFGKAILDGLFTVIVDLGDAFTEAADASREISDGVQELSEGVGELSDGVRELRDGARELADGYAEFDDGLKQYVDGVGQLADGLSEFERETRDLGQLTDGVQVYAEGVGGLIQILIALDDGPIPGLIPAIEGAAQFNLTQQGLAVPDNFDFLGGLKDGGPALASETGKAIRAIQEGLRQSRDGARELASANKELLDGSSEIRSGTSELASGVRELNDGVRELDDGVAELADGVEEFADALTEGAEEIASESPGEVADATLTNLVRPVMSENDSGRLSSGVNDNLTAVIIPLGLWLSSLLLIVALPAPRLRALGSTVSSTRLLVRQLAPTLVMSLAQATVALTLVHTLGGVSLSALGWTLPLVVAGALAFVSLHFLVWAWRPQAVVPVSLAVLVLQIATFGVLLPAQILPEIYQTVAGFGPISWLADALLGAASGDAAGRVAGVLIGLLLTAVVSLLVSRALFGARRHTMVKDYYLTGSAA
jgi:putative membrane protein